MKIDYQKKFSLKNKKVYIFGGMGTIGKEVTRALTQFGAKIVLLDLKIKKKNLKINLRASLLFTRNLIVKNLQIFP